jgi:glycosyltransferase involved in cell wall biosynthesis
MRILAVNHLLDAATGGGTAERTWQLCRALDAAGMECAVLTLDLGLDRLRDAGGVRIVAVPCLMRRYFVPWLSWPRLRREVAGADVIHLMGHWTLLNALVYLAARGAGRPYVFTPAGALAIIGRSRLLKRLYNFAVGNRIVRGAAAHVAIAASELADFSAHGVAAERIAIIPNGVAAPLPARDCAPFLERHGLAGRRFVLFLGRLSYIKGPDLLLEAYAAAARRLPDLDLVFAGPDDGLLAALERQAARLGVEERVRFTGYIAGEDKSCALRACALLAVPSRQEAMSIVALEAGIHGKPVLLTDRCGFDEVERIGGGRLAEASAASIARALAEMAADPAALERMGARLHVHVRDHYTWERAAAAHKALFERVCAS